MGGDKNTIAVIATPADEDSFRDDRGGYHMPLKAFDMNISSTMLPVDVLCAQDQQYCMHHNGVSDRLAVQEDCLACLGKGWTVALELRCSL